MQSDIYTAFYSKQLGQWLLCFFLGLIPVLSHAGIFRSDSIDFTDDEKQQFQDSFDRFPQKILPNLIPMGGAIWLDNQHVIMTVNEMPDGWNTETMLIPKTDLSPVVEPHLFTSRIVTVDVQSNAIQDSIYPAGDLVCVDNGRIVIGVPPKTGAFDEYFSGKYGEKLTPMTHLLRGQKPHLIWVNCSEMDRKGKFLTFKLLPEHGTLEITKDLSFSLKAIPMSLYDPVGQLIATIQLTADAMPIGLRYLRYRNQYVSEGIVNEKTKHSGFLLSSDGKYSYIESDPFLASLAQKYHGSGTVRMTKIGPFWTYYTTSDRWGQRGLYFRESGKLLRIDDSQVGSLAVSPDGCKLFYDRTTGNPKTIYQKLDFGRRKLVVLELCENSIKN